MKKITAKEFREIGLLQEVNRRLLHPMGLALEVVINEDGTEHFGEVWDSREDPEGIHFVDGMISSQKAETVADLFESKASYRKQNLGYHIQPIRSVAASIAEDNRVMGLIKNIIVDEADGKDSDAGLG